ncbi:MAG: Sir2 family NAD-dependent protein deacetylase, partial [Crocinitomicaceae bacterium]
MKKKLVVFSGAGMSAESGISTFRDSGGLWEKYKIEEVATPEAWRRNPDLVTDFYNQRRKQILESAPNLAHIQLVKWEEIFETFVITQNIDVLHERAGSHNVLHLHGNIRMAKSSGPNQEKKYYPVNGWELKIGDVCDDGYRLRPHVVWF